MNSFSIIFLLTIFTWHANSHDPGGDRKADNDCQQASNILCGGVKVFCNCNQCGDGPTTALLQYEPNTKQR
ncbi:hypothetical protein FOZ63_006148 [Perkinsus olseni]|uniref:Uncharacterized protein n=1 Tax=Perkinsus olseni TaxID=32597 RepID=A0A7J6R740_PEROL|nr:hypothetical protein FOZ63_006148 [Perkinsus olseni]